MNNNYDRIISYNNDNKSPSNSFTDIAIVKEYNIQTHKGFVNYNNQNMPFTNATFFNLHVGDKIIVSYVNREQTLYALGVVETKYNPSNDIVFYYPNTYAYNGTSNVIINATSGNNPPADKSYFIRTGNLISFYIEIDFSNVDLTTVPTGQIKVDMPVKALTGSYNHFIGWLWEDITISPDLANHTIINADYRNSSDARLLDLHYLAEDPATPKPVIEKLFTKTEPKTLTSNSRIYINGSYIVGEY